MVGIITRSGLHPTTVVRKYSPHHGRYSRSRIRPDSCLVFFQYHIDLMSGQPRLKPDFPSMITYLAFLPGRTQFTDNPFINTLSRQRSPSGTESDVHPGFRSDSQQLLYLLRGIGPNDDFRFDIEVRTVPGINLPVKIGSENLVGIEYSTQAM